MIGNGDIKSKEDAKKMFELTGVDGIMIGRAALGNPWIFKDVIEYLSTNDEKENTNYNKYGVSNEEKLRIILKHIALEVEEKGEIVAIKEMRKHISWYIKNYREASKFRDVVNKIDNRQELEACIKEYFKNL